MLKRGKINITIDGQFGSTGKGVLNSYIGMKDPVDLAVSNAAPNAGHTFDIGQGKKTVFHLPVSGVINPAAQMYLCAGAIIDPVVLQKEMEEFRCEKRVFIHPRATILTGKHLQEEAGDSHVRHLASTRKGVGAALADKIRRGEGVKLARDFWPEKCSDTLVQRAIDRKDVILMEVPQGFDLSINHGLAYPHCTSRDITISSALNDAGCHPFDLGKVFVSIRTYPIRVGNILDEEGEVVGYSGPFWSDSDELSWKEVGQSEELTTVTKRVRRVATFSMLQYENMLRALRPDYVFVNFMNYVRTSEEFKQLNNKMFAAEEATGVYPIKWAGMGPSVYDVLQCEQGAIRLP